MKRVKKFANRKVTPFSQIANKPIQLLYVALSKYIQSNSNLFVKTIQFVYE